MSHYDPRAIPAPALRSDGPLPRPKPLCVPALEPPTARLSEEPESPDQTNPAPFWADCADYSVFAIFAALPAWHLGSWISWPSEVTGEVNPGAYDRILQYRHYSIDGLRGAERGLWEGGHRVPFLVRWPGRIEPGSESGETICHVDFLATVAALLGEKLPPDAGEDSVNVLPALLGEKPGYPLRAAVVHSKRPQETTATNEANPPWFTEERGYSRVIQPGQLFNVRADLSERKNHFADHPDLVREMKALLDQYRTSGRSTPLER